MMEGREKIDESLLLFFQILCYELTIVSVYGSMIQQLKTVKIQRCFSKEQRINGTPLFPKQQGSNKQGHLLQALYLSPVYLHCIATCP